MRRIERRKNHGPRYIPKSVEIRAVQAALTLIGALFITGVILFVISLFSPPASAAEAWTPAQVTGETSYLVLHTVDWAQTRWIAKHGPYYYESFNGLLGPHPSVGKVNWWFGITTITQPIIAHFTQGLWRDIWIGGGVAVEFNLTTHNESIGVGVNLPW